MDVNAIFEAGGVKVPNPNYSKSKKNKQPKYINATDIDNAIPIGSGLAGETYRAASIGEQDILGTEKELEKYKAYNITPNDWEDLNSQLAKYQSNWTKFGNSLAQTVISELAIGIPKGFSDLVDFVGQSFGLSDKDYSNPVSKYLEEKQEEFRNFAPIYRDESLNIANGGLTDAGWWASNFPSIISSLTLLIPSAGIVKGISYAGKALNAGARTRQAIRAMSGASKRLRAAQTARAAGKSVEEVNKIGKLHPVQTFLTSSSTAKQTALFLENGTTAALSRTMENYQEARQTYNSMYTEASEYFKDDNKFQDFVSKNEEILKNANVDYRNKDEVAKYIATSAADRTFQIDWVNIVSDVIQMYGLRNAWKGLKNAHDTPAKVRRANLDQAKYAGKTQDEIKAIKDKLGFKTKAKEYIGDKLYGSKLAVASQLGEGVEEAINYIATEEGMRFGKILMGKEKGINKGTLENILTGFDGRLISYALTPELYDSAFWGVLGGVVFQAGGSKIQRVYNKITDRKSEANKEAKQSLPWYSLDELPEIKSRITEIQARGIDFKNFTDKLKRINNNEAVEGYIDENATEEEKQIARNKLKDEFISKMTLRAMNSGNFDLLRSYLSDDNLRKAFAESGVFNDVNNRKSNSEIEQESKQFIDDALLKMDEVARTYDEELNAIDFASANISNTLNGKSFVPVEYMQIMATDNVYAKLARNRLNNELNSVNERISTLMSDEDIMSRLDPNIQYEEHVKLAVLTNELGKLYAQRKRILNSDKSLSNEISLSEINKQIENIENELTDTQLILATHEALRYNINEDGSYSQEDTLESIKYKDSLITNRGKVAPGNRYIFNDEILDRINDRAKKELTEEAFGEYDVTSQDFDNALRRLNASRTNVEKSETGIRELDSLFQRKAILSQSIKNINSSIIKTDQEVEEAAGMLHNTMNEIRQKAIDDAYDTISELYDKYGNSIREYLVDRFYQTPNRRFRQENMSKEDLNKLEEAFDVLNLAKSYNRSLGTVVDELLDIQDKINAGKSTEEANVIIINGEENITSQEADTTPIAQQLNNPTQQQINTNTEQQNRQIEQQQTVTDPQQTENRQPIFYTYFRTKNNTYRSSRHSNEDNGGAAIYDNGDGTYTVDVRNDARMKNDSGLFSNASSIDLTRPNEIVSKPIAKRNRNGKLEIIQKGELVNTDTLEYQESKAVEQEEQIEEPINQQNDNNIQEENNIFNTNQETQQQSTNIPTGDVVEQASNVPKTIEKRIEDIDDVLVVENSLEDDVRQDSLKIFIDEVRKDKTVNLEEIANKLIESYIQRGFPRDIITAAVNKSRNIIETKLANRLNAKTTMKSAITEVIVETANVQSSITEERRNNTNPFIQAYKDSVKTMIEEYAKEFGIEKYNNKYYINLEDLLRFVNEVSNDSTTARIIFDSLRSYLSTNEAKNEFIVLDENEANNTSKFLENIGKSVQERYNERIEELTNQRIDVNSILQTLTTEQEKDEFYKRLDELNVGDKLTYTVDNGRITIRNKDQKPIAYLSIPKIDSKTGGYVMSNDGWITDVLIDNTGGIISKFRDTLLNLLNETTPTAKELNSIIYEFAFSKPNKERKAELLEKFKNNPEIKLAKTKGLINSNATNEQLINGLSKLWRYKSYRNSNVTSLKNKSIKNTIDNWFKNLWNSYNSVKALQNNQIKDITISFINEGEIIRITNSGAYDVALPANKAIAGGPNPNIHKIAVSKNGKLNTSGMGNLSFSIGDNQTFVVFPNRSGFSDYVQAYPAEVTSDYINNEAKEIISSIHNNIESLFNDYSKNPNEENFNKIKDFFNKAFYSNKGKQSLFYGISVIDVGNVLVINLGNRKIAIKNGSTTLDITNEEYPLDENNRHQKKFNITSDETKRNIKEFINNLRFNISPIYITSDNNKLLNLDGIVTRTKDGKFQIKIGNDIWIYDSYNAFLLNNNLVRLNTKPNENGTSNYSRTGNRTQKANQVIRINLNTNIGSPVEDRKSETITPAEYITKSVNDKVKDILNSNDSNLHKGLSIAAFIANDEQLKKLKRFNILPKNIIFDEKFNKVPGREEVNAAVNPKTGQVVVGTKWMELFNNINTRKEAIRKLIHEQLHIKLYGNTEAINKAKEIYNEFKEYLNKTNVPINDHIREYLFENENPEVAIEEFLVESITSQELAEYLNTIEAKVDKKRGRTLFQQIMDFIAKMFDWKINKGSLLEKEFYTLRDIFSNNINTNKETKSSKLVNENQPGLFDNIETQEKPDINDTVEKSTEKEPIKHIIVEDKDNPVNNSYGEDFSDDLIDELESSITELSTTNDDIRFSNVTELASNIPTVQAMQDRLSPEQQPKFASLVASAAIRSSCK